MRKLSYEEFVNTSASKGYSALFLKHVELGNVDMYEYSSFSGLRRLVKLGMISYDGQNKLFGVRKTDKPLTEDVLY